MNTTNRIPTLDARPGDRFAFIAAETRDRFGGLVLARERALVQIRWTDRHESWTPLEVDAGMVEVYRNGKSGDAAMAVTAPGTNHQEPAAQVRERRTCAGVAGA